jgi:NADH-quinone oxidoreductase subunit M
MLHTQYMVIAVLAVSGVVLGAWYMLSLVQRVFFGPLREAHLSPNEAGAVRDLSAREMLALGPLLVFIVWIGVYPRLFLEPIDKTADKLVEIVEPAFNRQYNLPIDTQ